MVGDVNPAQTVLITGGTRGIGFAAAAVLGSLGYRIVLVGQDAGRAEDAAKTLGQRGIAAYGYGCNVASADDVADLAAALQQDPATSSIDVLITSAGVMSERMAKTLRTRPEEWQRVMGVNLDGVFNCVAAFVPGMVERRSGRVITVSACLGRFTGPGLSGGLAPYRISKTAVNALTRNLAAELQYGKRGVLVDAMCPNHCRTDMGGPDAPRSAEEGADTIVWLATRDATLPNGDPVATGLLWEDREQVPW
jgi:NAD(P)-dependent dehydrogenase (short-subunit alcohol dehydrogenase family)